MRNIYIDPKEKIILREEDKRVMEVIFYDSLLNNIYRGKIVNKIDSLSSYFVEISDDENLFLKSSLSYAIGDNAIVEYVREPANGKLGLASENFILENESYKLSRYPLKAKAKRKAGKKKDDILFKELNDKKAWLINQEKFYPSPKLLIENSIKDSYLKKYESYKISEIDIRNSLVFTNLIKELKESKLAYKDLSIIIDELETLTVIDVNTGSRKSKMGKEDFLLGINLELIDFIAYNLKLRNIGGMCLIDFLRVNNQERIIEAMQKAIEKYQIEAEIFGFTRMGLFEISIKRRGDSLKKALRKRKLIS